MTRAANDRPCNVRSRDDIVPWDDRWGADEKGWDEYTELVSTLVDEVLPLRVPTTSDFLYQVAADVVMVIIEDSDMRRMMLALLDATGDEVDHVDG
jgi:hypothetical protein